MLRSVLRIFQVRVVLQVDDFQFWIEGDFGLRIILAGLAVPRWFSEWLRDGAPLFTSRAPVGPYIKLQLTIHEQPLNPGCQGLHTRLDCFC